MHKTSNVEIDGTTRHKTGCALIPSGSDVIYASIFNNITVTTIFNTKEKQKKSIQIYVEKHLNRSCVYLLLSRMQKSNKSTSIVVEYQE